ncbi:MAG: pyruvate kinase [Chloroflexi bacterium]|nr:pyruvate kinase [Chloroflexota bacterium]
MTSSLHGIRRPKTKIVCTLGPSTESKETIRALIESGMSVARLNLSHGSMDTHVSAIEMVRTVSEELGIPVGIMVDVPGAKYRTGPLAPGVIDLVTGDELTLTSRDVVGTQRIVGVAPPGIHRDAEAGRPILLDDGFIELRVISIQSRDVLCEVIVGGRLTERRGVATPGKSPSQKFPDEAAITALKFAAEYQADFVALSTVITENDIRSARKILEEHGLDAQIISKIERAEALENCDAIIEASDAIMVARGDMGVEIPLARVPVVQKDLIARCNAAGKPVITATQMLESMVKSPVPTRAEVTDVANAVFDGTDAVMLSGETSVGQYPIHAVKLMAQVAIEAEAALPYEAMILDRARYVQQQTDDAISYNACRTAFRLEASLIVAFTESGGTAGRVSKFRPRQHILALTPHERMQRRLTLRWGVTPVIVNAPETVEDLFAKGEEQAVQVGGVESGSQIVLVAGLPIGVPGGTNLLRVMTIP